MGDLPALGVTFSYASIDMWKLAHLRVTFCPRFVPLIYMGDLHTLGVTFSYASIDMWKLAHLRVTFRRTRVCCPKSQSVVQAFSKRFPLKNEAIACAALFSVLSTHNQIRTGWRTCSAQDQPLLSHNASL